MAELLDEIQLKRLFLTSAKYLALLLPALIHLSIDILKLIKEQVL